MDDLAKAIIRYEKARQRVARVTKRRNLLISQCRKITEPEDKDIQDYIDGETCLSAAYKETIALNKGCREGDGYEYEEVLGGDDYCETCLKAYQIKRLSLSLAKIKLGYAKSALSAIGKRLIRES